MPSIHFFPAYPMQGFGGGWGGGWGLSLNAAAIGQVCGRVSTERQTAIVPSP